MRRRARFESCAWAGDHLARISEVIQSTYVTASASKPTYTTAVYYATPQQPTDKRKQCRIRPLPG